MNFYQHSPEQINQLATALEDPDLDMKGLGWKAAFHLRELQALILDLEAQLCAIGAGGVGQSIQPPAQADTEAPLRCDVCGVECANPWHFSTETKRHKHACDACWGRMKIPGQVGELDHTTAPQQEPVAWIEHEWSGTGLRHLHFEKREPMVRDEVVNPVWTPLYTAPPQRQPLTEDQIAAAVGQCETDLKTEFLIEFARAIEEAHGITGGQQ